MNEIGKARTGPRNRLRRFAPIVVLGIGFVLFFWFDLDRFLTFESLSNNRGWLLAEVAERPVITIGVYMIVYVAMVAVSIPGALVLTMTGGFLFGIVTGSIAIVIASTTGACIIFLAARTALGNLLRERAGGQLKKFEDGFKKNAFSYLLVLRLVPVFPFFLVNLAPAFLGVSLRHFALATGLGVIPGTVVYASLGNGLGAIFDRDEEPNLGLIFEPEILLPLIGLALLSLLPVLYRRFRRDRPDETPRT